MIKNAHLLNDLNHQYQQKSKRTYQEALVIFEGLWNEAVHLGKLPLKNPLEGIEKDYRIAKALNHPQYKSNV